MMANQPIQQPFEPTDDAQYMVMYYEEGRLQKLFGRIRFPTSGGVQVIRRDGSEIYLPAVHKIEKLRAGGGLNDG